MLAMQLFIEWVMLYHLPSSAGNANVPVDTRGASLHSLHSSVSETHPSL